MPKGEWHCPKVLGKVNSILTELKLLARCGGDGEERQCTETRAVPNLPRRPSSHPALGNKWKPKSTGPEFDAAQVTCTHTSWVNSCSRVSFQNTKAVKKHLWLYVLFVMEKFNWMDKFDHSLKLLFWDKCHQSRLVHSITVWLYLCIYELQLWHCMVFKEIDLDSLSIFWLWDDSVL